MTRRGFLLTASTALAADAVKVTDIKREKVTVTASGQLLLEYRYAADRPKPYVHPLCLPGGEPVTLDGPKDHVHHRGLMVAWSEVNGIDFWGETNPARHGQIVHRRFERVRGGPSADIVAINEWVAEGKTLLVERCAIRVPPPLDEGVWLEWTTELTAQEPVKLAAGEHVYNGLGIRFIAALDGGDVLNSNGAHTIAEANGDQARWCAYYRGPGGVAMFDAPSNPRHPNAFFVMNKDFGYMSAAPTFRAPFDLAGRESIRFRWGVLAFGGEPKSGILDRRFAAWSKELRENDERQLGNRSSRNR